METKRRALCLAPLAALAACAADRIAPRGAALAGRAWDVAARRFVEPAEARARIAAAPVALLGETHDNPAHHRIQRSILEQALHAGRRPALAMEQIDLEWQVPVDQAIAGGASAARVGEVAHATRGWDWPLYAPIVALAISNALPVVALNLPRERTRRLVAAGLDSLGPDEATRLALAATWNAQREAALHREIVQGHCGDDSPIVAKLVQVQRAKDAVMADRILAHAGRGVVATIGRGHARRDLGVPLYLAARAPALRVLSLGLTEIDPDARGVEDYAESRPGRFDLLWFTEPAAREDPCLAFKGVPARP